MLICLQIYKKNAEASIPLSIISIFTTKLYTLKRNYFVPLHRQKDNEMKTTKTILLAVFLTGIAVTAVAQQTVVNGLTFGAKVGVRHILFDRERVTVVMSDGTKVDSVRRLKTQVDVSAGIDIPLSDVGAMSRRSDGIYDLLGRRMNVSDSSALRPGVYVRRKAGRVVKFKIGH